MAKKETELSVLKEIRDILKPKSFCVSAGLPEGERFVRNNHLVVLDNKTKLMWGSTFEKEMTWADAIKACKELTLAGHKDWRLPTVEELASLVDYSKREPAIDTKAFPDTKSSWYWSSTSLAGSDVSAWCVIFSYGNVFNDYKNFYHYVRPVRTSE